jgi:hypothetical protein
MKTHPSQDQAPRRETHAADHTQADREPAGPYGYGHRAHKPDPTASYVFQPGPPRTLPVEKRRRWRVPG